MTEPSPAEPEHIAAPEDARPKFHDHISTRRERALLAIGAFVVTVGLARAVTGVLHAKGAGENGGLVIAGVHLHHFVFGIAILLATSFSWLLLGGIDDQHPRWFRITAITFGVGAGLLLDEFALWLNLEDVYWQQKGRQSIEVICVFAGVLALGLLVRPYGGAVRQARSKRRKG